VAACGIYQRRALLRICILNDIESGSDSGKIVARWRHGAKRRRGNAQMAASTRKKMTSRYLNAAHAHAYHRACYHCRVRASSIIRQPSAAPQRKNGEGGNEIIM